jgi:hypothetical protein
MGTMQQVPSHPVHVVPGDQVQIRVDSATVLAVVESIGKQHELRIRTGESLQVGDVLVRWIDAKGVAWRVPAALAVSADAGSYDVELLDEWQQDAMRASQRISGSRHSMRGEVQAGSLAPGVRFDFVVLDISASGCRASGVGRQPKSGDLIRLALQHPYEDERWQLARVMRLTPLAFGRFEVGLKFEIENPEERVFLASWRDAWAAQSGTSFTTSAVEEPGQAA